MAFDLKSIADEVGKTVASKLDKELDDGLVQTIVAEVLKVLGGSLSTAGDELLSLNNNNDGN